MVMIQGPQQTLSESKTGPTMMSFVINQSNGPPEEKFDARRVRLLLTELFHITTDVLNSDPFIHRKGITSITRMQLTWSARIGERIGGTSADKRHRKESCDDNKHSRTD
jgi:hypothetical protein